MAKSVKLLLVENVDSLGIVGDVVNVRTGYARNFLLPRALATTPSEELVKQLAAKRADAQKAVALERKSREAAIAKLKDVEITLVRSVNDQGILYGAVTQQDIASALKELGHNVKPREVRIAQTIKRIDSFDVHVKLDSDLDATVRVHVKPDRELEAARKEEQEEADRREERSERSDPRDRWEEKQAARRNALDAAIAMALTEKPKGFGGGESKAAEAPAKDAGKAKAGKGEKSEKKSKK